MTQITADQVTQLLQLAQTYQNDGRFNDAINLCEQILESDFDQPDTRFFLGWLYQEQQRWDEAIQQFKHLQDNADYALSCKYALGQCYCAQADLRTATVHFDEAVDDVNLGTCTTEAIAETRLSVVRIYTSPHQGQPMVAQKEITVIKGKGIIGDRYFLDSFDGFFNNHHVPNSQRVITLISLEGIEEANKVMQKLGGTPMRPEETRRNLVVSIHVHALNALVGQEFDVGGIRMRGVASSTPCWRPPTLSGRPQDVSAFARAFLNNSGIRAVPLTSGLIHEGDRIALPKSKLQQR
jgi:MOSC domain-containing protein YiiM